MNKNNLPPLYLQVKQYLIDRIEKGQYKKNEKLPSERELSEKLNISRMTIRNAIKDLVDEGYAYRDGARGTFVASDKVKRNFITFDAFSSFLKQSGISDARTEVVEFSQVDADRWLAEKLEVRVGTLCYKLFRIRYGNDMPMTFEQVYLNAEKIKGLMKYDFGTVSLYKTLENDFGRIPKRSVHTLELSYFSNDISRQLQVNNGTPGFLVKGKTYDQNNELLEYSKIYNRGDLFMYMYELNR